MATMNSEKEETPTTENTSPRPEKHRRHPLRFWLIIAALSLLAFICALDATIITTPLPSIVEDIGGEQDFIWIANAFMVAAAVLQPLTGQVADMLGRKIPTLVCIALFMLGSGLAGGAHSSAMFIAGRTVQGAGAGGIYVLIDIVCCDLVPLHDRGKYLGIINAWAGVASALGPVVGGAFGGRHWPWIFYINLPICALPFCVILLFMRVKTGKKAGQGESGPLQRLRQLDVFGNLIFIPSIIAILYGLVTGGIQHPWSSWRVILPLILGAAGWVVFHIQQHSFSTNPMVPTRLFGNRTSAAGYALTLLASIVAQAALYFVPVYLQAIVGADVLHAGTYFLPTALGILVAAATAGVILSRTGNYRVLHWTAFALSSLGFGLFTLLDEGTHTVAWVFYQLIIAAGAGIPISTLLPAIMAALPESDVAASTAAFSFTKTFGYIWGVTVPSILFNAVFNDRLSTIGDADIRHQLKNGGAYAFAGRAHNVRPSMPSETWSEVAAVYALSLRSIWWLGLGLSLLGFLIVFAERRLELRTDLQTDYGMDVDDTAPEQGAE